ncbi:MAG: TlpA family protein disulfide reductase [Polyangiaceae bacterium]|jgi:hypothetical protein|nr:TlpA family protein disulfide reductase [Polyangiaceae bacterium]
MASATRPDAPSLPLQFKYRGLDGREVSSDAALGRLTVIAFITTYDIASQAQARFLSGIQRGFTPRTNCYAFVLDRPESTPLVEAFVHTLDLGYPVAHAPREQLAKSSLHLVRSVPSVIVLDRGGHLAWQSRGLVTEDELRAVLQGLD